MANPTMDDLLAFEVGTVMEAGKLLPSITAEPVVHQVSAVDPVARTVRVRSTFFGVWVGNFVAVEDDNGKPVWTMEKRA